MSDFSGKWKVSHKNSKELNKVLRFSGYGKIASKYISSKNLVVNVKHSIDEISKEEEICLTVKAAFTKTVKTYPLKEHIRESVDFNRQKYMEQIEYDRDTKKLKIKTVYLEKPINIKEEWTLLEEDKCQHNITVLDPSQGVLSTQINYQKI